MHVDVSTRRLQHPRRKLPVFLSRMQNCSNCQYRNGNACPTKEYFTGENNVESHLPIRDGYAQVGSSSQTRQSAAKIYRVTTYNTTNQCCVAVPFLGGSGSPRSRSRLQLRTNWVGSSSRQKKAAPGGTGLNTNFLLA